MKRWQRWLLAIPAVVFCVAATQWAVKGTHEATGNIGYLGTELAGVEGVNSYGTIGRLAQNQTGVIGLAEELGVYGSATATGVEGSGSAATGVGVKGTGGNKGVWGVAGSGGSNPAGVFGEGPSVGVYGVSSGGYAVEGVTLNGTGVYGVLQDGGAGHAGYFQGRVHVNGTLSKSAGSFKIDHPLDPGGKYLSHSFVESPDMKNIYDGVVTLSDNGTAVVELPEWFEALNKDFRYQLTCIGEHAPVYVSEEIAQNRFRIAGGYRGMKVSWQVTGSRHDAYAKAYPIAVEETKSPLESGRFLHPELHEAPAGLRIGPSRVVQ